MNEKEATEYKIFKKWSKTCPYQIIPASIKNEEPPKPDISCKLKDGTPIAFELVEIIDKSYARRFNNKLKIEKEFDEIFKGLSIEKQRKFERLEIRVKYNQKVIKNKKISIIPKILEYILEKGCEIGDYYFHNKLDFKGILYSVSITQEVPIEPIFHVSDAGSVGIPELERIKEKFNKTYKTPLKIELLTYYQLYFESPECLWLSQVYQFVRENIESSPFERVWIYSVNQDEIIYSFSNESVNTGRPHNETGISLYHKT